jgi:hypothetical protein
VVLVTLSLTAARDHAGSWLPLFGCVGLCGFLGMHLGSFDSEAPVVSKSIPSAQLEAQLKQSLNEE